MMNTIKNYRYRITFYTPTGIKRYEKTAPKLPLHLLFYAITSASCIECN